MEIQQKKRTRRKVERKISEKEKKIKTEKKNKRSQFKLFSVLLLSLPPPKKENSTHPPPHCRRRPESRLWSTLHTLLAMSETQQRVRRVPTSSRGKKERKKIKAKWKFTNQEQMRQYLEATWSLSETRARRKKRQKKSRRTHWNMRNLEDSNLHSFSVVLFSPWFSSLFLRSTFIHFTFIVAVDGRLVLAPAWV